MDPNTIAIVYEQNGRNIANKEKIILATAKMVRDDHNHNELLPEYEMDIKSNTKKLPSSPPDNYRLNEIYFLALGLLSWLPWNVLMTAEDVST